MNTEKPVITVHDLEGARELGRLSGEVRVLKWGAAIVVTMMFAYLTYLAQQINDVRSDLTRQIAALQQQDNEIRDDLTRQISELHREVTRQTYAMQEGQAAIRERLTTVEQRLVADSL